MSKSVDNLDLQLKRKRLRVAQYELADELGVHASVLSTFENGRRQSLPGDRGREEYLAALYRLARSREGAA